MRKRGRKKLKKKDGWRIKEKFEIKEKKRKSWRKMGGRGKIIEWENGKRNEKRWMIVIKKEKRKCWKGLGRRKKIEG